MTAAEGGVTTGPGPDQAAMSPADVSLERRVSLFILAATPILFLIFLALTPPVNPTFDDAKYIAVGRNFLSGNGPITEFGVVFLKHSPLWPMIIAFPEKLAGIHPVATGHLINAVSGALTIVLVGYLGWRVRPAIGAISAVLFAALPYVFDIARTAGIDLPSIMLTLLYVIVGFSVVRTGALWRAVVLGAIFAVAFLIKETILPFAIVPFILGAMWGVRWTNIVRTAAVTLAAAAVGMSWWFVMFAGYTHLVYRADFPDWTLLPSAAAVVLVLIVGLAAERIAAAIDRRGWNVTAARRIPARLQDRTVLGWLAVLVWFVLLTIFFGRTPKLLGASLFDPRQVAYMVVHSLGSVRLTFAYGLGTFLVVAELIRDRRRVAQASSDALVTMICGIPLVLLVIGVGETPRHYIQELALVILTGTIGWYHGLLRLRERDRLTAGLFAGLAALGILILALSTLQRITPRVIVVGVVGVTVLVVAALVTLRWLRTHGRLGALGAVVTAAVFVIAIGAVGVRAVRMPGITSANEAKATADTIAWIKANVPSGGTVAFGPYLSMETSIDLPPGYKAIQVRHYLAVGDPKAPLGLRSASGTGTDYVAVDTAPIKANQFNVYSASLMIRLMKDNDALYYVYPVTRARSSKMVLNVLTPENGFTEVDTRTYPGPTDTIDVHTYKVDLDKLDIPTDRMFIATDALERLVINLEGSPATGATAAGNLLDAIVPPADGSENALLDRLKKLAGR